MSQTTTTKSQVTGTVVGGALKLDESLDLPENSRVTVTVEAFDEETRKAIEAWESFKQRIKDHPVNSGGMHFTRDELHERR